MKNYLLFFLAFVTTFLVDRVLKELFYLGWNWHSSCISLEFVLNKGVAFSMLSFLGGALKWILLGVVGAIGIVAIKEKLISTHPLLSGLLLGAAVGNLYDRFVYGGVIDYVYWHCGFEFAIFNFADVVIDIAVVAFLYLHFRKKLL